MGQDNVGSMVVFQDGLAKKAHYRKFGIRGQVGMDDFAAMAEMISRRFARLSDGTGDQHDASFASAHPGKRPSDVISLHGHDQVLWPDHCVQGTPGAELHEGLPSEWIDAIIRKGADPTVDSYSGFRNNWNVMGERPPTGLAGLLKERGMTHVLVCGLARDYCVKWTAEDSAAAGFRTRFLWDLTRPVDAKSDARVREELGQAGVEVV